MNNVSQKRKRIKIIILSVFAIILIAALCISAFADVGNVYADSDYDYDYDYDYGSGDSDYSSNSSADIGLLISILFSIPFPFNILIIGGIIAVSVYFKKNRSKLSNLADSSRPPEADLSKLTANDPDFSSREFIAFVRDVYIAIQSAWSNTEWNVIRPFESNELFETHNKQLNEYIDKRTKPNLEKQEIKSADIVKYDVDGKYEYLTVKLSASLIDYTTDEQGNVVSGSKTERRHRTYRLEFKRVNGVKTKILQEGNSVTNCPKCGAPTDVTSSGKCNYCGSVITTGEYSWVLDTYAAWNPNYR